MRIISENEYKRRLKRIRAENIYKQRLLDLKNEEQKYKKKHKLPSTSKLILFVVILLCIEIVLFSEYIMITTNDISALYTLIGVPVTLVPTIWSYYSKSKIENSKNGIVYDLTMSKYNQNNNSANESTEKDNSVG